MKSLDIAGMKPGHILIAALLVLAVTVGQFVAVNKAREAETRLNETVQEMQLQKSVLEARSGPVIKYKESLKSDKAKLPETIETPNRFYADLLELLGAHGLNGAEAAKANENDGLTSFKVTGTANYNKLIDLLASFRLGNYLIKVDTLTLDGLNDNNVSYSFTVSAMVSMPEALPEAENR